MGYDSIAFAYYQNGLFAGTTDANQAYAVVAYPWQPALGTWHHVAYTFDGTSHALYLDGIQVAMGANTHVPAYDEHPALIGADYYTDVNSSIVDFFVGKIDEFSFYSRALSANEIQSIFNAGSLGKCTAAPLTLPLTTGAGNKLDLGAFAGGDGLALTFSGSGDLIDNRLTAKPDGSLAIPASGPYSFANQAAPYSNLSGGDGINHFAGGGQNFDTTGAGYGFAGKLTTNTTDPAAIRSGAVVGTFSSTPARADWFLIGNGKTVQVPAGGAHLYVAVNDSFSGDNHGAYVGTVTAGATIPPVPPVHGGLSPTVFTVNESDSVLSPPPVDSILRFRAAQTGAPADLSVQVQSSTDYNPANPAAATWTFLPDSLSGKMTYAPQVTGYILATTNYPTVNGVYFRAVSSAPAYPTTGSNVVGPFNLQSSALHLAAPVLLVSTNGGHSSLRFGVKETTIPAGISVRIQTSQTPVNQGSWTDAPIGVGSSAGLMTQDSAAPNQFYLGTDNYPASRGVYFRAVAGAVASGYVSSTSVVYGPFEIVYDPPATVHIQINGVESQRNGIDDGILIPATGSLDLGATATSGRFLKYGITLLYDGIKLITSGEGASSVQLANYRTNIPGDHVIEAYAIDDLGVTGAAAPIHVRILPNAPGKIFQMTNSGNWDVPANWVDIQGNPGIPGPNDFAIISTFSPILTNRDVTVKAMSLNGGTLKSSDPVANVVHTLTVTGFGTLAAGNITSNLLIPSGATCLLLNDSDIGLSGLLDNRGRLRFHGKGGIGGVRSGADGNSPELLTEVLGVLKSAGQAFISWASGGRSGSGAQPAPAPAAPAREVRRIAAARIEIPLASLKTEPAPVVAQILSHDSGGIVSHDGGGIVSHDGGGLVAAGAGNVLAGATSALVAPGADASLISQDGAGLAVEGSNLIAAGAGNLLGQDGAGLIAAGAGNLVAPGAGNAPAPRQGKPDEATVTSGIFLSGGELDLSRLTIEGDVTMDGGVLTGTGIILGNLTNNSGFLAPGALEVTGAFSQGPNGTLVVADGGVTPDQYNQLQIGGAANLNGNLILRTANGYAPDMADTFNPLGYASVTGDFAAISANSQAVLTPSGVLTSLTPVATNPLILMNAVSRKTHGTAGTFDIPLPLTGALPGVECRSSAGGYTLVFTFSNNLVSGTAVVSAGTGVVQSAPVRSGNTMTVQLSGITDVQEIGVNLQQVIDEFGQILPDTTVNMRVLVGDTNGNGAVSSSDISQIKTQSGAAVSAANFRLDVNANGAISSSDTALVKSNSGHTLP
ncbi:MAG: LamG-like jellyroll fold domain-containing protein [Chthoniobacterales bacterium]